MKVAGLNRIGDAALAGTLTSPGHRVWPLNAAVVAVWLTAVSTARVVDIGHPAVHRFALLVHLVSVVVSFGAVIFLDVYGLLWLFGQRDLRDILKLVSTGHALICLGLIGLIGSGLLLHPNLDSWLVRIKMGFVLVVMLNGVNAHCLSRRLWQLPGNPRGANIPWDCARPLFVAAAVSQTGWWGALLIGFVSSTASRAG
jgi:hypothetical protein